MWGRSNTTAVLQAEVNLLRQENERLREQNKSLQEALIATTSPVAYQNQLAARLAAEEADDPERGEQKNEDAFLERYLREMEASTFKSPDEFISFINAKRPSPLQEKLEDAVARPPALNSSLHGNTES